MQCCLQVIHADGTRRPLWYTNSHKAASNLSDDRYPDFSHKVSVICKHKIR
jgi:hypothetical protein